MKQLKLYVAIILLLVVLTALSFVLAAWWNPFTWHIWNVFNIFSKPQITTVQSDQNQTAGWKTYKNKDYLYELQYPDSISVKEGSCPVLCPDDPTAYVAFLDKNNSTNYFQIDIIGNSFTINDKPISSMTLEDMVKGIWAQDKKEENGGAPSNIKVGDIKTVSIGSDKAYVFSTENAVSLPWEGEILNGKVNLLFFSLPSNLKGYMTFKDKDAELINNVLATFKFTNNNTVDWSKYTQEQLLSMVKKEPWYAEQTYYKGLVNNFLILDQGTAPYPRQLIIYDLTAKKEVLFDAYSVPLDITSSAVAYWNVTNQKITAENCPDSVQWNKEGLGAEIESHVSFDFSTLKLKELGQTRCRPTQ